MDATDKYVVKSALEALKATGGMGTTKGALLKLMALAAPTADAETLDTAFQLLKDRGWVDFHLDGVWHEKRWTLTERGLTALEGM